MKRLEVWKVQLLGPDCDDWDEFDFDLLAEPDKGETEPWISDSGRIAEVTDEKFAELQAMSEARGKLHNELFGLHENGAESMEIFNETKGAGT